ncbi:MAG: sorbosone dehydrogenase family protein, partial [Saprospiraceae bacterium]|nr:sorbosone dehydrogenase family protein [Saprospiraceae bacterium]
MKNMLSLLLISIALSIWSCETNTTVQTQADLKASDFAAGPLPELPLDDINLPEGFEIAIFGEVDNARSLARSPEGTIYVGNRSGDKVYALKDEDGDFIADKKYIIDEGLKLPNGVAFKDGDLYVAEVNRILKYENIEDQLQSPPEPSIIFDGYPTDTHHGWKFIAFGPDDKLYVPVGAPCNICERLDNEFYASITRIDKDGSNIEVFASGVRNSVGFTWHPETDELWFTDNGRDMLGDDTPP